MGQSIYLSLFPKNSSSLIDTTQFLERLEASGVQLGGRKKPTVRSEVVLSWATLDGTITFPTDNDNPHIVISVANWPSVDEEDKQRFAETMRKIARECGFPYIALSCAPEHVAEIFQEVDGCRVFSTDAPSWYCDPAGAGAFTLWIDGESGFSPPQPADDAATIGRVDDFSDGYSEFRILEKHKRH